MFCAGPVAIAKLLTRGLTGAAELVESNTSKETKTGKTYELSSIQREKSGSNCNLSLQEWLSVKSLVTGRSFSEALSDRVSAEQHRQEEQDAMAPARDSSLV